MKRNISHFIGLKGIGGVQKNFSETISLLSKEFNNTVYTTGKPDAEYTDTFSLKIRNIYNPRNLLGLIFDIISKKKIVHFYNNINSKKLFLLLILLPTKNCIMHERGSVWNIIARANLIPKLLRNKFILFIANSDATSRMLQYKFQIKKSKIKVVHNGINTHRHIKKQKNEKFNLGFIGRFEPHKGIHILINAFHELIDIDKSLKNKINLNFAGDGPLLSLYKTKTACEKNIFFHGRVKDQYSFIASQDLLIAPSIREPFGNVFLEAGLCSTPIIASYIDGIPEIIQHNKEGFLIQPTEKINKTYLPNNILDLPEVIYYPKRHNIDFPRQINHKTLAKTILELINNPNKLESFALNLHQKVKIKFNVNEYVRKITNIYKSIL